jgi:hypothetical protein
MNALAPFCVGQVGEAVLDFAQHQSAEGAIGLDLLRDRVRDVDGQSTTWSCRLITWRRSMPSWRLRHAGRCLALSPSHRSLRPERRPLTSMFIGPKLPNQNRGE